MAVKNRRKGKITSKNIIDLRSNKLIAAIAVVLVAAVIISLAVIANTRRRTPQTAYDFGKPVAQGIDISEHNGEVDWDTVADDFDFAFIRVGYRGYGSGEICEDSYARENLKSAQSAGIPVGVYFYSQAVSEKEAEDEADFVLDIVRHYDIDLPVIIDFEYPADEDGYRTGRLNDADLTTRENTDIINAFCARVERKGYISGLYASSGVMYYNLDLDRLGDDTVIWTAEYNDSVTFEIEYDIWQYSRTGQADGVSSKYVDLNYWYSS